MTPPPSTRHPVGLPSGLAALDRCLVMGVLNVTPDSFSDGGLFLDEEFNHIAFALWRPPGTTPTAAPLSAADSTIATSGARA